MEVTSLGVQVHGGMGFVEETGAAQHMRDARILPIYEGTNGIQGLDLVGRKLARDKGKSAMELLDDLNQIVADAKSAGLTDIANSLEVSLAVCKEAANIVLAGAAEDWTVLSASAYNMLMLMGTTVAGAMLVKSAVAATNLNTKGEGNASFNNNKVVTAQFFVQHVMPRNAGYLEAVKTVSETVMGLDIEGF